MAGAYLAGKIKNELTKQDNLHGDNPSQPGEPPAKVTGRLSASISHQTDKDKLIEYVGSNVRYAKFLELGTIKMAARPFLRSTLETERQNIQRFINRKMKT
jgi:HK97 gp10 family phage protein